MIEPPGQSWKDVSMNDARECTMIKRLNTTLPDPLALHVGEITGSGTLSETPVISSAIWSGATWKTR